jgi:enterochelin esterase family protein
MMAVAADAQDMPLSQILIEGENWRPVTRGFNAFQGVAADTQGTIFAASADFGLIHRIDADGKVSSFVEVDDSFRGLCFGPDGRLYAGQPAKRQIVALEANGEPNVIAEGIAIHDLVRTPTGTFYCTVPTEHAVYRVDAAGQKQVVDRGITTPTGIALWPDAGTLVVADARGKHLWAFRIEKNGDLAHKERYYPVRVGPGQITSGAGGMTVDTMGRVYVTSNEGIQMFDSTGRLSGVLLNPALEPVTTITFGGPSLDTLYVVAGKTVYARKTRAKGIPIKGKP